MDKVEQFFKLKQLWIEANSVDQIAIDRELTALIADFTPDDLNRLTKGVEKDFGRMHSEAKEIEKTLSVRESLSDILPIISVSYLAKHYFGKSASWFYQRMNGNKVHGKTASFTPDELQTLDNALKQISKKIGSLSIL